MTTKNFSLVLPFINAEGEGGGDPEPVVFTEAQKLRVAELVSERVGQTQAANRKEWETKEATLKAEYEKQLEEVRKASGTQNDAAKEEEYRRVIEDNKTKAKNAEELATRTEKEKKALEKEMFQMQKSSAMRNAMAKTPFLNTEDVLKLTSANVEWDKDTKSWIVRDDNGAIMQDDTLKPLSLEKFYAQYAEKRPYFVRSDAKGGANSSSSSGGETNFSTIKSKADLKTAAEKSAYIKKHGLSKFEALPLK